MRPAALHRPGLNKPQLNLDTGDIPGAQPHPKNAVERPRGTNPLEPHYKLASWCATCAFFELRDMPCALRGPAASSSFCTACTHAAGAPFAHTHTHIHTCTHTPCQHSPAAPPPPAPKFLGDPLDVSDIRGASPTRGPKPRAGALASLSLSVIGIEGAAAARRAQQRHAGHAAAAALGGPDPAAAAGGGGALCRHSNLDVSDINTRARRRPKSAAAAGAGCGDSSGAGADSAAPRDYYKGDPGGPARPRHVHPRVKREEQDNSLRTFDIIGVG